VLFLSSCSEDIKSNKNLAQDTIRPTVTSQKEKLTIIPKPDNFPYIEPDDAVISKMWKKPGIYYTGAKLEDIDNSLGLDFKKDLNKACELTDEKNSKHENIMVNIQQPLKINFSKMSNISEDYAIIVDVDGNAGAPTSRKYLFVYIKDTNKYTLKLTEESYRFGFGGGFTDIDSDGKKEILIEMYVDKNDAYAAVLRYSGTKFSTIFKEDLYYVLYNSPFKFDNSYEFVENESNPKLVDILFKIHTTWDEKEYKNPDDDFFRKKYASDKPIALKDEIVFHFDGEKYVPNKEVYNFGKYID
jgi:hypothetical protein